MDDFVGEVISSFKVADTGIMVINAANGVEVGTEIIWGICRPPEKAHAVCGQPPG